MGLHARDAPAATRRVDRTAVRTAACQFAAQLSAPSRIRGTSVRGARVSESVLRTEILRADSGYEGSVDLVKKRLARMRPSKVRPAQKMSRLHCRWALFRGRR
jgi:hypothetical protein